MERAPQFRRGRISRVTAEVQQQLREAVGQQADIRLWELQAHLQKASGVGLSQSLLGLWLQKPGLGRKKVAPRARARQASQPATAANVPANPAHDRARGFDFSR